MGKKHKYVAKQSSNKHAPPEERHEPEPPEVLVAEGLRFQELISLSRDNINRREATCYILSVKWLNSWKDYTGYELLIKGSSFKSFRRGSQYPQVVRQEAARQAQHRSVDEGRKEVHPGAGIAAGVCVPECRLRFGHAAGQGLHYG